MRGNRWLEYNRGSDTIEIIYRDGSGAKIEQFKFKTSDKVKGGEVMRYLKEKYNFEPEIKPKIDDDIKWMRSKGKI